MTTTYCAKHTPRAPASISCVEFLVVLSSFYFYNSYSLFYALFSDNIVYLIKEIDFDYFIYLISMF